jgi:hypothetical protein
MQENFCEVSTLVREVSTLVRLPPPLWGRVGERGRPRAPDGVIARCRANYSSDEIDARGDTNLVVLQTAEQATPLSPTLPRKGGGNPSAGASLTDRRTVAAARADEKPHEQNLREVSTQLRLPPPLWGRVGERGRPRAPDGVIARCRANYSRDEIDARGDTNLVVLQAAEQATPLSLTLPRKGGGNPSAGASLTNGTAIAVSCAVARERSIA